MQGLRKLHNQEWSPRILSYSVISSCILLAALLLFKDILLCMQEHNPSLIQIIAAADSRKLERTEESRNLMATRGSKGERLDEVPMVLFRWGSFILHKPPNMLITIANMQAALVKVRLHTLNELLMLPLECTSDCFLGA